MTISEKRLAEIREALSRREFCGDPCGMARDLLAMLDTWRSWDATFSGGARAYIAALEVDQRRLVVAEQAAAEATERAEDAERKLAALHATRETWLTDPAAVQARALEALDVQRAHESGPAPPSFAEVVAAEARRVIDEARGARAARNQWSVVSTHGHRWTAEMQWSVVSTHGHRWTAEMNDDPESLGGATVELYRDGEFEQCVTWIGSDLYDPKSRVPEDVLSALAFSMRASPPT